MSIEHNQDGTTRHSGIYGWESASVNVAGVLADTSLVGIAGFTTLLTPFTAVPRETHYIKISSTGTLYVSINGGAIITIGATTPFEANELSVKTIGVSSGGAAVTVTVQIQ